MIPPLTDEECNVLAGLDPAFTWAPLAHRKACLDRGVPFILESGRRSFEFQKILHDHPELHPGSLAAAPGSSYHEVGFAYDAGGTRNALQQLTFGALAEELGLTWGGRFKPQPDGNHIQSSLARAVLVDYVRVRWGTL
jgi:hypothetical protein